jgi:hypothetical protein
LVDELTATGAEIEHGRGGIDVVLEEGVAQRRPEHALVDQLVAAEASVVEPGQLALLVELVRFGVQDVLLPCITTEDRA